jgi:ubiquinone biosynthesis protein UbiJ
MAQASERIGVTLFDSLQNTLIAVAEIGGNHLLALDEAALRGCAELQGFCIAFDFTDLDFQLYCHPGSWGLRLSRGVSTSMRERVSFHGNIAIAQKMQAILAGLDIDWEEMLARHCGDVLAFQLHQRARKFSDWLRYGADSLLQTSSEYLREEARLSPTQVEFDRFQSELTVLKQDVARAEARLQRLLDKTAQR